MANRRPDPVSYRPFRVQPVLSEGLLAVARPGGDLLDRVSDGLFRIAAEQGQIADRQAARQGALAGQQDALAGRPQAEFAGGGVAAPGAPAGGASAATPLTGTKAERAARVKSYLMDKHGVSNEFASGLVGQFAQESGFDTRAINPGDGNDGSDSIGIAQWNGKRARSLRQFASAKGRPVDDLETQLDFVMHELSTSEKAVGNRLRAARSVEEATAAAIGYERPQGWTPQNPRGGHGWSNRLAAAQSVYGIDPVRTGQTNIGAPIDRSRPILENADGTFSTEETITVDIERDGKKVWVNLPTIVDGKRVGEGEAVRLYRQGKNKSVGEFSSLNEAETSAQARTQAIGDTREGDRNAGGPKFSGGTFRPSGRDTIYGRARDEAGSKTYVQLLEGEMRSTTSQLFEQHRDDPAALQQALSDNRDDMMKAHVFPEIRADFEVGYGQMAERYVSQARENLARKVEVQDRAAFIERTGELETDQQRRLADFDPHSENAADAIASSQAAIDANYDDAVRRGVLDPDDAARAKIVSRREAALGYYGKQANALDADSIATMRKEMEKDFADGGIEGLDGDGWAKLDAGLQKLEVQKRNEAERGAADFRKRGDAMAARMVAGFDIDQAELAKFMLESGEQPGGKEALQETLAKISAGRAIRDMSVKQGNDYVAGLKKQYGDQPSEAQLRTLQFSAGMLQQKKTAIATDSVSYAEAQNIVPATPFLTDAETADDLAATMGQRVESAELAGRELGTATRYLKAGEAKALSAAVKADPEKGVSIAGAIVAGAGDRAAAVLAEFGSDAPMIAEAGAIIAFGGSAAAAADVIGGYGKSPDGKKLLSLKPEAAGESFRSVAGNALAMAGKDAQRIKNAAAAISRKRITDEGLDPASDEALAIHAQAVQEAAGGVFDRGVQFGGFADLDRPGIFTGSAKVLVPPSVRADAFGDVIDSLTEDDLQSLPVKPKAGISYFASTQRRDKRSLRATIGDGVPVAVQGGYAFALGDPASDDPQFIMGEDGNVFVLDIVSMRDRLAPRVPGAFR